MHDHRNRLKESSVKALILLSHGSHRRESTEEMLGLAEAVAALRDQPFDLVACAFQQFTRPTLDETVNDLVGRGVTQLVVFPLFLAAGSHVAVDVPQMIERARQRYPEVSIAVTPHLGRISDLASFLLEQASRHV